MTRLFRRARFAVGVLALLALCAASCKKKDVAQEVAAQAAEEAAAAATIASEAPADVLGLAVYPGARRTDGLLISGEEGATYNGRATYTTPDSYDAVVAFYTAEMPEGRLSEVESGGLRCASIAEATSTETEVATRMVQVCETRAGTEIALCVTGGEARFTVSLVSVEDDKGVAVAQAICDWRAPATAEAAEIMREETEKLLPVLPRPVEPDLTREEAEALAEAIRAAGGVAEIH